MLIGRGLAGMRHIQLQNCTGLFAMKGKKNQKSLMLQVCHVF